MRVRRFSRVAQLTALALAPLLAAPTQAADVPADWPSRPLKLIIPFPPGGAADSIGRLLATELGERLGQPVVPENRPGAGTAIAAEAAARAAPDGYTLSLATTGQLTILPALQSNLKFDPVKSFAPVALVASGSYVVSVPVAAKIPDLKSLLTHASQHPGEVSYSSCGVGTACHLTGVLLNALSQANMLHVPFAGSAPAVQAVLGGHVQVAVDTETVQAPHIRAGTLRPLVITSATRSPALPDVPTAAEAGLPEFLSSGWFGVVVPAATPTPIVERLNTEIVAATQSVKVRAAFDSQGLTPLGGTPAGFSAQIQEDLNKWRRVVNERGVTTQ
ncbi:tripartite tricarboxylate transporter substrate binding protein [Achromobacter sp. GG226]|uniref:Bug family tripartite tricarboxylate transporter substrate binding protein n=1 Tax=Verticiella alkaliphila TaxID=2779529 RepID=UPI001C0D5D1B|nr:tripartite tricarboxylate transporter substrate-binding protein [Verticiella sp. GG226]MBU4612416.1 tripartite tricarboxylate transporter substrate binding protein [Verticiella sp. GG226]